jgi:hypothetical protein
MKRNQSMQANPWPFRCLIHNTSTKFARAATNAALIFSDALPFGRLWHGDPNAVTNAISYAKFFSRSHDSVIRVYDQAGNAIENA